MRDNVRSLPDGAGIFLGLVLSLPIWTALIMLGWLLR